MLLKIHDRSKLDVLDKIGPVCEAQGAHSPCVVIHSLIPRHRRRLLGCEGVADATPKNKRDQPDRIAGHDTGKSYSGDDTRSMCVLT